MVRIERTRGGVVVDALDVATQRIERWQAASAVVALPVHVAARVVQDAPGFLKDAALRVVQAPWLVANLHLRAPLHDRPGAAPSWDNVLYGDAATAPGLGYVDAKHQSLQTVAGATVLTYYRALGDAYGSPLVGRQLLQHKPWAQWRDEIVAELSVAHPDLASKVTRMEITRYGHAMAVPVPQGLCVRRSQNQSVAGHCRCRPGAVCALPTATGRATRCLKRRSLPDTWPAVAW